MRHAEAANLADVYRHGCEIVLPAHGELMVTGDLHGNFANFDRIVALADLDSHRERHLILQEVVHALETRRGRDLSFLALEQQAALKAQYPDRVHVLLGNHELSEFQGRKVFKDGRMLNKLFRRGVVAAYGEHAARVIEGYRRYFRTLPIGVRAGRLLFCHSTPEGRYIHRYDRAFFQRPPNLYDVVQKTLVEELVWGRDYAAEVADRFAAQVDCELMIVGHTPCDHGFSVPSHRHVILDSKDEHGAYMLLRLGQSYNQRELVERIRPLW
jgi:hypothetical protein